MACAMQTFDASVKQTVEDTLGYRVTIWKLSTLLSHRVSIQKFVEAPKSVNQLQGLASNFKFDFTLRGFGEIPALRDRWESIYSVLPLHAKLVHVVWKYISKQRNNSAIYREMQDECKHYARIDFEHLLGDIWNRLNASNIEKAMKHVLQNDVQEQLLAIDSRSEKYINELEQDVLDKEMEISSRNKTLELIIEALNQVHVISNSADQKDGDLSSVTLLQVRQHIAFAEKLQKQLNKKEAEGQRLQQIINNLKYDLVEKEAKLKANYRTIAEGNELLQGFKDFLKEERSRLNEHINHQNEHIEQQKLILQQVRSELEEERKDHRSALEKLQHAERKTTVKILNLNQNLVARDLTSSAPHHLSVIGRRPAKFLAVEDITEEDRMQLSSCTLPPITKR